MCISLIGDCSLNHPITQAAWAKPTDLCSNSTVKVFVGKREIGSNVDLNDRGTDGSTAFVIANTSMQSSDTRIVDYRSTKCL